MAWPAAPPAPATIAAMKFAGSASTKPTQNFALLVMPGRGATGATGAAGYGAAGPVE